MRELLPDRGRLLGHCRQVVDEELAGVLPDLIVAGRDQRLSTGAPNRGSAPRGGLVLRTQVDTVSRVLVENVEQRLLTAPQEMPWQSRPRASSFTRTTETMAGSSW
jgi:hypothetical protein